MIKRNIGDISLIYKNISIFFGITSKIIMLMTILKCGLDINWRYKSKFKSKIVLITIYIYKIVEKYVYQTIELNLFEARNRL